MRDGGSFDGSRREVAGDATGRKEGTGRGSRSAAARSQADWPVPTSASTPSPGRGPAEQ